MTCLTRQMAGALLACLALAWGCAVDLSIKKKDGSTVDVPPDDDLDHSDLVDVDDVQEDDPGGDCGNGTIDTGEDCDGDPPRTCTTTCGSEGTQECVDCHWADCTPPPEICNDVDDDCDDMTDESGEIVLLTDPVVRVTNDPGASESPAIAWSGSEFVIVWTDDQEGGPGGAYSASVAADFGITPGGSPLLEDGANLVDPDLVWSNAGSIYGMVAADAVGGGTPDIVFQSMDPDGTPDAFRVVADDETLIYRSPAIAARAGGFMMVWDSSFTVHYILTNNRGNPTGVPADLDGDGNVSRDPDIAAGGTDLGVVWVDEREGNAEIYSAVLTSLGVPACTNVNISEGDEATSDEPSVVWDGSAFAVAWHDTRSGGGISLGGFNTTCTVVRDVVRVVSGNDPRRPSIAWTGSTFGLAWHTTGASEHVAFQVLMDSGVPVTVVFEVAATSAGTISPVLAYTGSIFGLAWQDDRDGNDEIYFAGLEHVPCP